VTTLITILGDPVRTLYGQPSILGRFTRQLAWEVRRRHDGEHRRPVS